MPTCVPFPPPTFLTSRSVAHASPPCHRAVIFGEYAEMAQQFGYLVLFGVVWPVAPIWSLINNFVRRSSSPLYLSPSLPLPSLSWDFC